MTKSMLHRPRRAAFGQSLIELFNEMKKLTKRYKSWLLKRARRQAKIPARLSRRKARIVYAWFGTETERLLVSKPPIIPPATLSLADSTEETLRFFDMLRKTLRVKSSETRPERFDWAVGKRRGNKLRRIRSYIDFSQIGSVSTAAALVLASEYDASGKLIGSVPPTIELDKWNETTFKSLYEIGFFEIVGLAERVSDLYEIDGESITMKIVSGSDTTQLEEACRQIELLVGRLDSGTVTLPRDVELALNSSLAEAIMNVGSHAYPHGIPLAYKHLSQWWLTASVQKSTRKLTVVIYDHGATIPVTYARKSWSRAAADRLKRLLLTTVSFEYGNDGAYIEAAALPGKTQTGKAHRGLGIPQMKEIIDICGSGRMTIWSRGGEYVYLGSGRDRSVSRDVSIGGTLIEWEVLVPSATGGSSDA